MDDWKTISFWVSAHFQVRTVSFREGAVDGRNPAPADMVNIYIDIYIYYKYPIIQPGFCHTSQAASQSSTINSMNRWAPLKTLVHNGS